MDKREPMSKKQERKVEKMIKEAYQEGFEAGQHETTPQYKKDMVDAYEKGRKDMREEIKKVIKGMKLDYLEDDHDYNQAISDILKKIENLIKL